MREVCVCVYKKVKAKHKLIYSYSNGVMDKAFQNATRTHLLFVATIEKCNATFVIAPCDGSV